MNLNQFFTKVIKLPASSWFVCLFFLFACNKTSQPIDPPKIKEAKMVRILEEVHLAEAMVQIHKINERDSIAALLYQKIFDIHQIAEADFYQSVEAYGKQPIVMTRIYDSVVVHLESDSKNDIKAEGLKNKIEGKLNTK